MTAKAGWYALSSDDKVLSFLFKELGWGRVLSVKQPATVVVTVHIYYPARRFAQQNPELASAKMQFIAFCVQREACYCTKTTLLAYYEQ